jgi:hypothetical protein
MALVESRGRTAALHFKIANLLVGAPVLEVPLAQLLVKLLLVSLVLGPAHVENIWLPIVVDNFLHEVFTLVKVITAGKESTAVGIATINLYSQAPGAGLLGQETVHDRLMRSRSFLAVWHERKSMARQVCLER